MFVLNKVIERLLLMQFKHFDQGLRIKCVECHVYCNNANTRITARNTKKKIPFSTRKN